MDQEGNQLGYRPFDWVRKQLGLKGNTNAFHVYDKQLMFEF